MSRWYFVRHGQSTANAEGWFAGHIDVPLTLAGRAQAVEARAALERTVFTHALCSDLTRACETAQIILEGRSVPTVMDKALRERSCGAWERRPIAELVARGDFDRLHAFDERPPGGESLRDVAQRALLFLATHAHGADTLVVCHGALMRAVVGVIDGTDSERIGLWKPSNCEITVREATGPTLAGLARQLRR